MGGVSKYADVDATNNRAERAIRHAVLWRKTSTATQTPDGDRFVERILSIRETCRSQNRPMHPYLVDVHNARHHRPTDTKPDRRPLTPKPRKT